jgi:hypothetical protein
MFCSGRRTDKETENERMIVLRTATSISPSTSRANLDEDGRTDNDIVWMQKFIGVISSPLVDETRVRLSVGE